MRRFGGVRAASARKRTGTAESNSAPRQADVPHCAPAAYDFVHLTRPQIRRLVEWQPQWIYFGTLYHTSKRALDSTLRLLAKYLPPRAFTT